MKYSRLIVIAASNLDARINVLFGLEELAADGIPVSFYDVSQITYKYPIVSNQIEKIQSYSCLSKKDFENLIKQDTEKSLYIVYMDYCQKTSFIFRTLSKHNKDIACCSNGVLPLRARTLKQRFSTITISKISHFLSTKFFEFIKKTHFYSPERIQFNTCGKSKIVYKIDEKTTLIPFNSTDFVYSQNCEKQSLRNRYIVFLDIYLPYHPDVYLSGMQNVSPQNYYNSLNAFFDRLEEQTGYNVVIAAHPVATKYKTEDFFKGREVIWGETASLVYSSEGVIDHCSTAVSFAVLFKKPMITIVSNDIEDKMPEVYDCSLQYSRFFKSRLVNIDDIDDDLSFNAIDEAIYNSYKYDYLTNRESEFIPNSGIIKSVLMNGI